MRAIGLRCRKRQQRNGEKNWQHHSCDINPLSELRLLYEEINTFTYPHRQSRGKKQLEIKLDGEPAGTVTN